MIIDGNALLHRAWHALPPLTTAKGEVVNAVYGFTTILMRALKELRPTHAVVTFDRRAPTFRHEAYAAYKATRIKQPQELYDQIDRIKSVVRGFGIPIFEKDGYEADDIIATLVHIIPTKLPDTETLILTGDMDTLQLVDEHTKVSTFKKSIADTIVYDERAVRERYDGLNPKDLTLYKALRGDPSDNIPGVKGIGEKTAIGLVKQFSTLEALQRAVQQGDEAIKGKTLALLRDYAEDLVMSYDLVRLRNDVPIDFKESDALMASPNAEVLVPLFRELEFKTLIPRLQSIGDRDTETTEHQTERNESYHLLDTEEKIDALISVLTNISCCAIDTETTDLNPLHAQLLGISISWKTGEAYYVPWQCANDSQKNKLKFFLENPEQKKTGHNIKYDLHVFKNAGIELAGIEMDTMIGAYILNPGGRAYGLDALSFQEFGYQKIPIESLIGKGKQQISMSAVPLNALSEYACEDADYTWRLKKSISDKLIKEKLEEVCDRFEIPLIPVLARMERHGIAIDTMFLGKLSQVFHGKLQELEQEIYRFANDTEFNINSPQQLKKILFDVLKIQPPKLKKGKTGISTAASELEKMRDLHPIIDKVLEYREWTKLTSTYIDVLPTLIDSLTSRVHTSFNQTIAATGRLSSSDPNFQNIPIRTSEGREIRKGIVAKKGTLLVAADYSQIELRIVASFAKDKTMLDAFREGRDIHTATAAAVRGIDITEVTKDMRRAAKEVNFGLVYGMGPHGLARASGMTPEQARDFIDRYFEVYPGIKEYMEETLRSARAQGYVETMFGRRRYLPELSSNLFQLRAAAERAAINMPIQGTSADIIKLAMIAIDGHIMRRTDCCMILQVHDELVFEVKSEAVDEIAQLIKKEMEQVVELATPLVVDMKKGYNWGEMESMV